MIKFLIGMALFFSVHSISVIALPLRDRLASSHPAAWKAGYSLTALAGLVLIAIGYGEWRLNPVILYVPPAWMWHVVPVLLIPMFILFLAPYFPGRISEKTRHPQLVAIKSWALLHLLVNGTLADLILFGGFLMWGGAVRLSLKYREPRPLPAATRSKANDLIVVVLGLALYALFVFWAHQALFGVDPLIAFSM